jgi:hypothetical protein
MSKVRSSSFTASPAKRIVRQIWNTPFLEYIHNQYGVKYRYFGLPGPNIEDVRLWKNMIEEVVAFELPPLGVGERANIVQLRTNLKKLKILHVVYCGSFEDVVIRRKDMEGQEYKQERLITLYNLDFCDEISSYVATQELGQKRLRYEAIRVILLDQKHCYRNSSDGRPCYFIILLTVRNQIEAERVIEYMTRDKPLEDTHSYFLSCSKKPGIPTSGSVMGTHAWAIKALLYDLIMTDFKGHNIDSLLFPILKYSGTPIVKLGKTPVASPMFHWMLLCRFGSEENPSPRVYPPDFLKKVNSLSVVGSSISISTEPEEDLNRTQQINPVKWFQQYESAFVSGGRLI